MRLKRGGPITTPAQPATITEWLQGHRHDGRSLPRHLCNMIRHRRGLPWLGTGIGKRLHDHLTAAGCDCCSRQAMNALTWIDGMGAAVAMHSEEAAALLARHATIHEWPITCPVALKSALVDCCHDHAHATGCSLEKPEPRPRKRLQRKTTR